MYSRQLELLQQCFSCLALQGGVMKPFFFIMPDDKLHTAIAKIAYAVKKYNRVGCIHHAKVSYHILISKERKQQMRF